MTDKTPKYNSAKERPMNTDLDDLFATARANPAPVPRALLDRVEAEALAQQPRPALHTGWRGWLAALGGAPGVGGLITATCVGVWIGAAPPAPLPDMGGLVLGFETGAVTDDGLGSFGWDSEEG